MHDLIAEIGSFVFVEDTPEKADLIMLVGGSQPQAGETAARLWREGYAPRLLIGGGVSIKTGVFPGPHSKTEVYSRRYDTEYVFYKHVLMHNGVPETAVYGENRSRFTRENALFAKQAAEQHGLAPKKALLVCQAFHARRSLMFYRSAFPHTEFYVVPYAGHGITRENWFLSEYGISRVLGELKRCGEQLALGDIQNFQRGFMDD